MTYNPSKCCLQTLLLQERTVVANFPSSTFSTMPLQHKNKKNKGRDEGRLPLILDFSMRIFPKISSLTSQPLLLSVLFFSNFSLFLFLFFIFILFKNLDFYLFIYFSIPIFISYILILHPFFMGNKSHLLLLNHIYYLSCNLNSPFLPLHTTHLLLTMKWSYSSKNLTTHYLMH